MKKGKGKSKKSARKSAISIVEDALDDVENASEEAALKREDAEFAAFMAAHPGITEERAAEYFSPDFQWNEEAVDEISDGNEDEVMAFTQEHPWLTVTEAVRYLYDPQLKWNRESLNEDDETTWQPILTKSGEIKRIVPEFSDPDLITDAKEYNRLCKSAGNDKKKLEMLQRRFFDAVKRDSYAKSDGWATLWSPIS